MSLLEILKCKLRPEQQQELETLIRFERIECRLEVWEQIARCRSRAATKRDLEEAEQRIVTEIKRHNADVAAISKLTGTLKKSSNALESAVEANQLAGQSGEPAGLKQEPEKQTSKPG